MNIEVFLSKFLNDARFVFPLFLITVAPFIYYYFQLRKEVALFRLYKVRDQWIYLVANKILDKEDEVFKSVYEIINKHLELAEHLTLDKYFERLIRFSLVDEGNSKEFKKFSHRVSLLPEEAKKVLKTFYMESLFVMREHSNTVKVIQFLAKYELFKWAEKQSQYKDYKTVEKSRDKLFTNTYASA